MVPRKLILVLALLGLGATCLQADDQPQGSAKVSEFAVTGDIQGTYRFDRPTGGRVNEEERRLILTRIEDESFDGVTLNGEVPEGGGSVVTGEDFQLTLTFERTDFRSDNGECVLEFTNVAVVPIKSPSGEVIASRLEFVTDITCSGLQGGRRRPEDHRCRGRRPLAARRAEALVPRLVTLLMFRASQERRRQGRKTKAHRWCVEDEDAADGGPGRRERGKRCVTGH